MGGKLLIVLAVLFLALSAIAIVYVLGIRSGSSPVRNAARRFYDTVGDAQPIAQQTRAQGHAFALMAGSS